MPHADAREPLSQLEKEKLVGGVRTRAGVHTRGTPGTLMHATK